MIMSNDAIKTMMEIIATAWPISGWLCGYFAMPAWIRDGDPFSYVVIFVSGALVGPFGVFWFFCREDRDHPYR